MALIPPHFSKSVVAIGNMDANGVPSWVASGFFFGRFVAQVDADNQTFSCFLVTNKHVLSGLTAPVIRANPVGSDPAADLPLSLVDAVGAPLWVGHPDPEVDVVVTGIGLELMRGQGFDVAFIPDSHAFTLSRMQSEGVSEGDALFLFGFPMALVFGPRSSAVVRGGTLAQVQAAYEGYAKSYIVDGYVFPGNSGGPVFNKPENISISGTQSVASANLIGIVSSYLPYRDVAISAQTGRERIVFEENSGLVNVFPVDSIEQTIDAWAVLHPPAPAETVLQEETPSVEDSQGDLAPGAGL